MTVEDTQELSQTLILVNTLIDEYISSCAFTIISLIGPCDKWIFDSFSCAENASILLSFHFFDNENIC